MSTRTDSKTVLTVVALIAGTLGGCTDLDTANTFTSTTVPQEDPICDQYPLCGTVYLGTCDNVPFSGCPAPSGCESQLMSYECFDEPTGDNVCGSWNPGNYISLSMGVYGVDAILVTNLFGDMSPLVECDDATFVSISGGFYVSGASSGELLYELGLRNGDVPLSLNSYPLNSLDNIIEAIYETWIFYGETSYELEISRNSSTTSLYYEIYFSPP